MQEATIESIEDALYISDWAYNQSFNKVLKTEIDTIYISGGTYEVAPGVTVACIHTTKYQTVKGFPLYTKSINFGYTNNSINTVTKRYTSKAALLNDDYTSIRYNQVYGQSGYIVTHSTVDGIKESYTFKSPIHTWRTTGETKYFGSADGKIVTEYYEGASLVRTRKTYGDLNGGTYVRTEYPDGSFIQVFTEGQADGTIYKEITEN